jgi:hypothetical protein
MGVFVSLVLPVILMVSVLPILIVGSFKRLRVVIDEEQSPNEAQRQL